jgi:hypothetical protein
MVEQASYMTVAFFNCKVCNVCPITGQPRATFVIQANLYQLPISPYAHGASKVLSSFIQLLHQRNLVQMDPIPLVTENLQLPKLCIRMLPS